MDPMKENAEIRSLRLAARQYGVISRPQLLKTGIAEDVLWRRLSSGLWEPVLPGVYAILGTPSSWQKDLLAACLWGGDGTVASHRAAAALWGFDSFAQGPIEVSGTKKTRSPRRNVTVHCVSVDPRHTTRRSGIPVTNAIRTLMDLGQRLQPERMDKALDGAIRDGHLSLDKLRRALEEAPFRGRRGNGMLRELLEQRAPGYIPSASDFQGRVRRLLAGAELPPMIEEYEVRDEGRFVARVDFAYPDVLLAVEADGYWCHSSRQDWQHDRTRRNALTSRGWRVLHVTWEDLKVRPDKVLAEIRVSLRTAPRQAR